MSIEIRTFPWANRTPEQWKGGFEKNAYPMRLFSAAITRNRAYAPDPGSLRLVVMGAAAQFALQPVLESHFNNDPELVAQEQLSLDETYKKTFFLSPADSQELAEIVTPFFEDVRLFKFYEAQRMVLQERQGEVRKGHEKDVQQRLGMAEEEFREVSSNHQLLSGVLYEELVLKGKVESKVRDVEPDSQQGEAYERFMRTLVRYYWEPLAINPEFALDIFIKTYVKNLGYPVANNRSRHEVHIPDTEKGADFLGNIAGKTDVVFEAEENQTIDLISRLADTEVGRRFVDALASGKSKLEATKEAGLDKKAAEKMFSQVRDRAAEVFDVHVEPRTKEAKIRSAKIQALALDPAKYQELLDKSKLSPKRRILMEGFFMFYEGDLDVAIKKLQEFLREKAGTEYSEKVITEQISRSLAIIAPEEIAQDIKEVRNTEEQERKRRKEHRELLEKLQEVEFTEDQIKALVKPVVAKLLMLTKENLRPTLDETIKVVAEKMGWQEYSTLRHIRAGIYALENNSSERQNTGLGHFAREKSRKLIKKLIEDPKYGEVWDSLPEDVKRVCETYVAREDLNMTELALHLSYKNSSSVSRKLAEVKYRMNQYLRDHMGQSDL